MFTALRNFRRRASVRRPSANRRADLAAMHRRGRKQYGRAYNQAVIETFDLSRRPEGVVSV